MVIQVHYKKKSEINIKDYLDENGVAFLEATTSDQAIRQLINHLTENHKLLNKEEFYQAVLEREKIVSTGIGMGIAIPHAKLPMYDDFFLAIGILKRGVHWSSLDKIPVRLIFLIGGPDDQQTLYLKLLSQLTFSLRDEQKRKKLLTLTSPKEIISLFKNS